MGAVFVSITDLWAAAASSSPLGSAPARLTRTDRTPV